MSPAVNRGLVTKFVDRVFSWLNGLPSETCSYSVQSIRIPLKDTVELAADLYRPIGLDPLGTILVRSPYGRGLPGSLASARMLAARGYQVLMSSCRGTFGSTGKFEPLLKEAEDGQEVVSWMREQSWYTGSFATLGGSYLGFNQWALLSNPPKDMKASIIQTGPHDFADFIWGTGALDSNIIAWADVQRYIESGLFTVIPALRSQKNRLQPVFDSVPLLEAIDRHFEGATPKSLRESLTHSNPKADNYFKPLQQTAALEKANIPILLTAGWNDIIMPNVIFQYGELSKRGVNVALTVGPWTHLGLQRDPSTMMETLNWLACYLSEHEKPSRPKPVRIHVGGANEWRSLSSWPPSTTPYELFLHAEKKLSTTPTMSDDSSSTFDFNPAEPTPSMAHPLLFDNGPGRSESDGALASRSDVLMFETDILNYDVEVCGKPGIELDHSTDHPHADLFVLLSEVDEKGRSSSLSEKYIRLPVDRGSEAIKLRLTDCAHRFKKGCRIRILIAGGSHPRYIRNLGTGADPVLGTEMQTVKHTVKYGLSKLILPATEAKP